MLNALDLFSGIGGFALALRGYAEPICYVEIDRYAQAVLRSRIADGSLPDAPIWDDVRSFDGLPWRGAVDIITGGFPCTDLSSASRGKGKGLEGKQSGLWYEMLRLIDEIKPGLVYVENVAGGAWRKWLPFVRRDLHEIGFASLPLQLSAASVGAPFAGDRIFLAATNCNGKPVIAFDAEMAVMQEPTRLGWSDWGAAPPDALGMADGVPFAMDRIKCLGNGVVPLQAREAFKRLMGL